MPSLFYRAEAKTLDFDVILEKALVHSTQMKIADLDVSISRQGVRLARVEYFPTLTGQLDTDYSRNLSGQPPSVRTAGTNVLINNTFFQNAAAFSLNYTVYDFGKRSCRLIYAKKDVLAKQLGKSQNLRDYKLKLLDFYSEALQIFQELKAKESMLAIRNQLFQTKKRLHEAGTATQLEMTDEALEVAKLTADIQELKNKYGDALKDLAFLTREAPYDPSQTTLAGFAVDESIRLETVDFTKLPEYRLAQTELEKKRLELELARRENLPKISFYSNYNFYGFAPHRYFATFSNFGQRAVSFGFATSVPMFDGFKASATTQKIELELSKLALEGEQKVAEERHRMEKLFTASFNGNQEILAREAVLLESQNKLALATRLAQHQLLDPVIPLRQQLDVLTQQLQATRAKTKQFANRKRLQLMAEALK
ncbi:MAG: TolC family protein [Cyanobacteria bacterium]|nr:TolC family protein [Cyanobacteriota bacterium]